MLIVGKHEEPTICIKASRYRLWSVTLSVCMLTDGPGSRSTAILKQFRPIADELVVAVDSRVDISEFSECDDLVDKMFRYEFMPPMERALGWLHNQCSGDWILRIDSDEVPSALLLEQLRDAIVARDALQFSVPRRWLFPDSNHWLDEVPWFPDYQFRLVRNDPATLRFSGLIHTSADVTLPARYLGAPIYHLVCITSLREQRTVKAWQYESQRPALLAPGGGNLNATYYLPELHAKLEPKLVPAEDAALIAQVMSTSARKSSAPFKDIPLVVRTEIDRQWAGRSFDQDAYRASITLLENDTRMNVGEQRLIHVRVINDGNESWPWGWQSPAIRLTYHWLNPEGTVLVYEGLRSCFPATVPPGGSCVVPALVAAPQEPATYILEFDLVHEGVRWFEQTTRVPIEVSFLFNEQD